MNSSHSSLNTLIRIVFVLLNIGYANAADKVCDVSVSAQFDEGAPRDYFHINNDSNTQWGINGFTLDLKPSAGQLIFDTEAGGKGVEVFQLFDVAPGTAKMSDAAIPDDGDAVLQISFDHFNPGETFSFSIDVDDQLVDSSLGQIRVSGSEIAGSMLTVQLINEQGDQRTQQLRFSEDNSTVIEVSGC